MGGSQQLTDTPGINVGGSYSPDGSKIVFESDRGGSQQIYVMNADGSNQHRISFFGGKAATPNGARAATRSPSPAWAAICHRRHRPATARRATLTHGWQDESPTWAPNGRIIQFFRTERGTGRSALWQVDLTGRHERRLPTPVDGSDPSWGRSGNDLTR
jgi:TolB protein